jgi:hypothetical protein
MVDDEAARRDIEKRIADDYVARRAAEDMIIRTGVR